jgi:predicted glycoside hydrolase/deacetylase ChbG (UPF0249 family)
MTRQLIVNADDFGRSRGVSAGIIRAYLEGIVSSTTALMNLPGVVNDLHQAKSEAPRLGLGVHLNFTVGRPLLPPEWCASLVDEHGHFLTQEAIMANPDRIKPDDLRAELKSQITTFKNAMEQLPDHLDAHHVVHLYPPLFQVYLEVAEAFKLPVRIPFPRGESELTQPPPIMGDVPAETVKAMLQADRQLLAQHAVKAPDHFIATFYDKTINVPFLMGVLTSLPQGTSELMTHPGLVDDQLRAESSYYAQREDELAVLTNPQVLASLDQLGIKLITFAEL